MSASAFPIRPGTSDRTAIEQSLTEELHGAKAAFDSANAQFKQVIENCKELRMKSDRTRDLQPVEEHVSVKDSLRIHRDAIVKYHRALENFNNFILYGRLPEFS